MQAGVGLLVLDVMPIYMIIPRYSHNYAQLCQLLNSNSFTHHKILMRLREATSETYGPWIYLHHINLPILSYFHCFYFTFRVVLWYLSVSPWSWSYTFACMISVRLNRGVTSWYQSRLPVGIPLPTPWPKSSLDIAKLLLTWLCVLWAHVAIGW